MESEATHILILKKKGSQQWALTRSQVVIFPFFPLHSGVLVLDGGSSRLTKVHATGTGVYWDGCWFLPFLNKSNSRLRLIWGLLSIGKHCSHSSVIKAWERVVITSVCGQILFMPAHWICLGTRKLLTVWFDLG
jgi:hypothetical protein